MLSTFYHQIYKITNSIVAYVNVQCTICNAHASLVQLLWKIGGSNTKIIIGFLFVIESDRFQG